LSFSTRSSTVNSQQSTVNNHGRCNRIDIIPKQALINVPDRESAYSPDVLVINQKNLSSEPLWKKSLTVTQAASVPLVIEVVSTNWQDDYAPKLVDYEILGIPEYWIIDCLGLGCGMCSKF
jgi:Uma2 family endonuclease